MSVVAMGDLTFGTTPNEERFLRIASPYLLKQKGAKPRRPPGPDPVRSLPLG